MNQLHMHTMLLIGVSICAVKTDPIGYNASPLPSVVISIPVCQLSCLWHAFGTYAAHALNWRSVNAYNISWFHMLQASPVCSCSEAAPTEPCQHADPSLQEISPKRLGGA